MVYKVYTAMHQGHQAHKIFWKSQNIAYGLRCYGLRSFSLGITENVMSSVPLPQQQIDKHTTYLIVRPNRLTKRHTVHHQILIGRRTPVFTLSGFGPTDRRMVCISAGLG